MESLGAYLKAQREHQGVALSDLLRETRLPRDVAEALEEDRYDALPAPVFARGFIRAYLHHLGVPAEEALAFYQARMEASLPPPPKDVVQAGWRRYVPVAASLGAGAVLSLGLYAYVALTRPSPPPPEAQPVSVQQSTLSSPGEQPAPATASPGVEPKAASLRLVARVIEPTWLRVQTDSGQTTQELLPASAVREWTARSRFVLTIGNAGGVRLELNGTPLPPLGSSGEVIRDLVLPRRAADPGRAAQAEER